MSEKTKKNTGKIVASVIGNVLFYVVIIFLLIFSISNIRAKANRGIPNIFGAGYLEVITESMEIENHETFGEKYPELVNKEIKVNDVIFVKMVKDKKNLHDLINVGDVIVFEHVIADKEVLVTHVLVGKILNIENDTYNYITQGLQSVETYGVYDPITNSSAQKEEKSAKSIYAVHTGTWSSGGSFVNFTQSKVGFAVLIILPVLILLMIQSVLLFNNYRKHKLATNPTIALSKEDADKLIELEREKMRAELLEEMKKEEKENKK